MTDYDALLLVSFGGPERAEDVVPFLQRVTAGRGIPEQRIEAVADHYYKAGGASPINARCRQLLAALAPEMAELGLRLYWGNRNWAPLLEDTMAQMRDDGIIRALAFVTSAYGGYSSCRQYQDDIARARAKVGPGAPDIEKLRLYYNHPGWVEPWAASLSEAFEQCVVAVGGLSRPTTVEGGHVAPDGAGWPVQGRPVQGRPVQGRPVQVLFSAHSIPLAMAATSPYVEHVTEAARLVAERAGTGSWQLVWQSRSGSPSSPWLGPDVCEVIEAGGAAGVVVVPVGFVCENMEVVHDLDVEAAATADKMKAHFVRASTVSAHPRFVQMVRELVQERLGPTVPPSALGPLGPWPPSCPEGHCPPAGRPASR